MTTLNPSEFLERVWPTPLMRNETLELRLIDRATDTIQREFFSSTKELLTRARKCEKFDVYFGVSTRHGRGGKKRDCYRVRTLWCDLDGRKISECCEFEPKPDIVVDSGGGSHAYWILDTPAFSKTRWREIESSNRGLCDKFSGDIAAIDVSRILRIPGFLNMKYDPPRIVRAYAL